MPADTTALPAGIAPCSPRVTGPRLLHVPLEQSCIQAHPAPKRAAQAVLAPLGARRLLPGRRGGARSPGPSGRGPSPERAQFSSAENMTSAEASAKGKAFLSCTAGSRTQLTGSEKAPGLPQKRGQAESPVFPAPCLGRGVTDGGP